MPPLPEDEPDQEVVPVDLEEFVRWWTGLTGGTREEAIRKHAEEFPDGQR